MNSTVYDNFKANFGFIEENVIRCDPISKNSIEVRLKDGDRFRYNDSLKALTKVNNRREFTTDNWKYWFSVNLREKMADADCDQTYLAKTVGLSQQAISGYLSQKTVPNAIVLHKIAIALNCEIADLTDPF